MNISCGTDIIEIDRIKESIENVGEKFLKEFLPMQKLDIVNLKKHRNINTMLVDLQ